MRHMAKKRKEPTPEPDYSSPKFKAALKKVLEFKPAKKAKRLDAKPQAS